MQGAVRVLQMDHSHMKLGFCPQHNVRLRIEVTPVSHPGGRSKEGNNSGSSSAS